MKNLITQIAESIDYRTWQQLSLQINSPIKSQVLDQTRFLIRLQIFPIWTRTRNQVWNQIK